MILVGLWLRLPRCDSPTLRGCGQWCGVDTDAFDASLQCDHKGCLHYRGCGTRTSLPTMDGDLCRPMVTAATMWQSYMVRRRRHTVWGTIVSKRRHLSNPRRESGVVNAYAILYRGAFWTCPEALNWHTAECPCRSWCKKSCKYIKKQEIWLMINNNLYFCNL